MPDLETKSEPVVEETKDARPEQFEDEATIDDPKPSASNLGNGIKELDIKESPSIPSVNKSPETADLPPEPQNSTSPKKPKIFTKLLVSSSTESIDVAWDVIDTESSITAEITEGDNVLILKMAHYLVNDAMQCHGLVLKSGSDDWYRRVGMFSAPDTLGFNEKRQVVLK